MRSKIGYSVILFSFIIPLILSGYPVFIRNALAKKEVSATTETDWGLHTATFKTPEGKIKVNLPDDMAAGDTISGTVIAEPSGMTLEERQRNTDELNGYVVEIEAKDKTVKEASVKTKLLKGVVIPTVLAGGVTTLILKDNKGKIVAKTEIPVQPKPPAVETPSVPTSDDFQLPRVGQVGRPIEVSGPFDGDIDNTDVQVGGNDLELLAESPRKVVAQSPRDIVGPTEIEVKEGNITASGSINYLRVKLLAPKTTLLRNESTTLTTTVEGLQGLAPETYPVPFELINESPGIIRFEEGTGQTIYETISQDSVGPKGTFTYSTEVVGIQPGAFNITARVYSLLGSYCLYRVKQAVGNCGSIKLNDIVCTSCKDPCPVLASCTGKFTVGKITYACVLEVARYSKFCLACFGHGKGSKGHVLEPGWSCK